MTNFTKLLAAALLAVGVAACGDDGGSNALKDAAGGMKDAAGSVADKAGDLAGKAGDMARYGKRRRFWRW